MDKFYQACYTRVGGTDRNSGWQLTNTSPDIPAKLLNAFEQRQKGNEPEGRKTPQNAKGEYLCALEIGCEADAVSFTRIQYGVPCHGREGSYSHGFLFPNAYELLKDPNRILALAEDHFCVCGERPEPEQALETYLNRSARIPEVLRYGEEWTPARALECAGMKQRTYKEFIYCLYGSWAKSAKTTIYVKTDGSDDMARALTYLAYVSLPYSMRPKLSVSTFKDDKNATLIFSHEQPDGCRYFDPATGQHNVLTSNQRKRWEKMPFVTMLFEEQGPQFDALERQLDEMGDRYSQDFTTLQTACQMGLDSADADPVDQLYDFLNIPQDFNEMMEQKVAKKLDEVSDIVTCQGLAMSDDMEKMLKERLKNARSSELINAGYRYKSARLTRMDWDEGCRYLKQDPDFDVLRKNLQKTESGLGMLTEYYRREIAAVTDEPDCSYEKLLECAGLFCDLRSMGDLWEMVRTAAKQIAAGQCRKAMLGARTGEVVTTEHTPLYLALEEYDGFVNRIQKLDKMDRGSCADVVDRIRDDITKTRSEWLVEYDKQFRRNFNPERMEEYWIFYTRDFTGIGGLRYSAMLLQKYLEAREGKLNALLDFTDGGCVFDVFTAGGPGHQRRERIVPGSQEERELIERSLYSCWTESDAVRRNLWMHEVIKACDADPSKKKVQRFWEMDCQAFRFWENAARLQHKNMIWLMLEKRSILLMEKMLIRSLAYNPYYWTDEKLSAVIGYCDACIRDGKAEAAQVRELLVIEYNQREEDREANRKKAKKMEKQVAQAEKQAAKVEKKAEKQAAKKNAQPGTPNKFTEEEPAIQTVYPGGYTQVMPTGGKKADYNNTDDVLDLVNAGHRQPEPHQTWEYGENEPNPLIPPEREEKTEKRGLFGLFGGKKRRS